MLAPELRMKFVDAIFREMRDGEPTVHAVERVVTGLRKNCRLSGWTQRATDAAVGDLLEVAKECMQAERAALDAIVEQLGGGNGAA